MSKKILIVDDEKHIVIPLQFLMEQNGFEVTVAYDGEEAMNCVGRSLPDLILLDIMLPHMDGYEVCQRIRQSPDWHAVKIVLITALGREMDSAKGLALGADAYITKPFSNKEVVETVRSLLKDRK
jgi:DNA-binding response OmpR family regulator